MLGLLLWLPVTLWAQTDTLYYDKEWKGIDKAFATYFRVIPATEDQTARKPLRNYFMSGELQAKGYYLTLDKQDDSNTIFDGNFTCYFKNGQIEQKGTRMAGKLQGEYIRYRENGLIAMKGNYKDNRLDGLYTEFSEDGNTCYQVEYADGVPVHDWCMISHKEGYCSKVRLSDNTPIFETPTVEEAQIEYQRGGCVDLL